MKIGSNYLGNGRCEFTVWAPAHEEVSVQLVSPAQRLLPMQKMDGVRFYDARSTNP